MIGNTDWSTIILVASLAYECFTDKPVNVQRVIGNEMNYKI